MATSLESILRRQIFPEYVRDDGTLTHPRSYGVYELPTNIGAGRRFRFGNHPIRMRELEREFGRCSRRYLFLSRSDAEEVARALNAGGG